MFERFLVVWLAGLSAVAYAWPLPFLTTRDGLDVLVAVTMLAIGVMLPRDEVRQLASRWPAVGFGTSVQYLSMPLLAYGAGHLFGFEGPMLTGIVLVGCVPGAMASNVLTIMARGNASYSVSLTTLATLLSPLVVPLAFRLLMQTDVSIDAWGVSRKLVLTVVLPVVGGHLLARSSERVYEAGRRWGPSIANLAILWIIAVVVAVNRDRLASATASVVLPLLAINLTGYAIGYSAAWRLRLPEGMRRALSLEVGMQNAGVGTMLAMEFFDAQAALAPALYTFGCMFTGTLLARVWASRPPAVPSADDE